MKTTTAGNAPAPAVVPRAAAAHETNPTLARALFSIWSGDPAVVVDSPPGAGKTHLITHLAQQLNARAGMVVAIAAQTRAQAYDVANRAAAAGAPTTFLDKMKAHRPAALDADVILRSAASLRGASGVVVATTARWQWTDSTHFHADVLLVDEAYQMTFADLGSLGTLADQFALVGDPGQIAPVVTANTRRWAHRSAGPQVPAPLALTEAHGEQITFLRLPQTWRLGPATTDLIKPLYSIDFTSARPPRHLATSQGRLPEYCAMPITITGGPSDPASAQAAARAVRKLLAEATVHEPQGTRPITAHDIAVLAPHVDQTTLIASALTDLPDVFVGTTNQAQGLEREAVVAVHPLTGYTEAQGFATDLGRLCVALSRHRSHLTMITDTNAPQTLARALRTNPSDTAAQTHQTILDRLLVGP